MTGRGMAALCLGLLEAFFANLAPAMAGVLVGVVAGWLGLAVVWATALGVLITVALCLWGDRLAMRLGMLTAAIMIMYKRPIDALGDTLIVIVLVPLSLWLGGDWGWGGAIALVLGAVAVGAALAHYVNKLIWSISTPKSLVQQMLDERDAAAGGDGDMNDGK